MALIKGERCGQMVANTGKCPKCGTLFCKECGHELGKKDIRCPNCGKGTERIKHKIKEGIILLCMGIFFTLICINIPGPPTIFHNICNIILTVGFIIWGLYLIIKYGLLTNK